MNRYNFERFCSRYGFPSSLMTTRPVLAIAPAPSGPWIVGGSILRLIEGRPQSADIDVCFADEQQLSSARMRLLALGYQLTSEKSFFQELSHPLEQAVQLLCVGFYKSPEMAIEAFDIEACMLAYDGIDLIVGKHTLFDIATRRIGFNAPGRKLATKRRAEKFRERGYQFALGAEEELAGFPEHGSSYDEEQEAAE